MSKYETTVLVRSQAEIIARYAATLRHNPDHRRIERMEYTRMMSYHSARKLRVTGDIFEQSDWAKEDIREIDHSAKALLRLWENKICVGSLDDSLRFTEMYVAFKWMLGHPDSDTLPGAIGSPGGVMNRAGFEYVRRQIITGEWDRLTNAAIDKKRGE